MSSTCVQDDISAEWISSNTFRRSSQRDTFNHMGSRSRTNPHTHPHTHPHTLRLFSLYQIHMNTPMEPARYRSNRKRLVSICTNLPSIWMLAWRIVGSGLALTCWISALRNLRGKRLSLGMDTPIIFIRNSYLCWFYPLPSRLRDPRENPQGSK